MSAPTTLGINQSDNRSPDEADGIDIGEVREGDPERGDGEERPGDEGQSRRASRRR